MTRSPRRRHAHLDRVEAEVAGKRCPECAARWVAVRVGAGRPGAIAVICSSGHAWVAYLHQGRLRIDAADGEPRMAADQGAGGSSGGRGALNNNSQCSGQSPALPSSRRNGGPPHG